MVNKAFNQTSEQRAYRRGYLHGWYVHRAEAFNEDAAADIRVEQAMLYVDERAAFDRGYADSRRS